MEKIDTFKNSMEIIEKASDGFGKFWDIDEKQLQGIKARCALIDSLMEEFDAVFFEITVEKESMDVLLRFATRTIQWIGHEDPRLRGLMMSNERTKFEHGEGDFIVTELRVKGLWREAVSE